MSLNHEHTVHGVNHHFGWDNSIAPALRIGDNTTVEFECLDASGGQLSSSSSPDDLRQLDFSKLNPVTGPVFIDGAAPGDTLEVTIDEFKPSGFGWTANIPGFGLLADSFKEPAIKIWEYDTTTMSPALYGDTARVPLKPFAGTIGNAPAESGSHAIIPPRNVGGNMDIRDLGRGTKLYLPVAVDGALFSIGDTHAGQGDGEVCGTAIESPMNVVLTFRILKQHKLESPMFETSQPVSRHLDGKGYLVTTGIENDLMKAVRSAVSRMIDLIASKYNYAPVDAYMLVSTCADLRISEIVNQPNWVVTFYFPRCVFD